MEAQDKARAAEAKQQEEVGYLLIQLPVIIADAVAPIAVVALFVCALIPTYPSFAGASTASFLPATPASCLPFHAYCCLQPIHVPFARDGATSRQKEQWQHPKWVAVCCVKEGGSRRSFAGRLCSAAGEGFIQCCCFVHGDSATISLDYNGVHNATRLMRSTALRFTVGWHFLSRLQLKIFMQAIQLSMREAQLQHQEQQKQRQREEREQGEWQGQPQQQVQLQPSQTHQQQRFIPAAHVDGASDTSFRPEDYDGGGDDDDVNEENDEEFQIALRLSMSDAEQR